MAPETTIETAETERTLADRMKENPKDYDFSDIPDVHTLPGREPATLKTMVGGFEYAGRDDVTGMEFWGRKPKVKQLSILLDLLEKDIEGEGIDFLRGTLDRFSRVCALLLYVQTGDGWRSATIDEIADAFDEQQMVAIKDRFSGLTVRTAATEGE